MKSQIYLIISLFILASCASFNRTENESTREPATASEKISDLATIFFKKNSYGSDKGLIRSLIEKAIIISDGKFLTSESLELRKESHAALFHYFLPEDTLPPPVKLDEVDALNAHLFELFSKNTSLAKFHLILQDLNFFTTRASYFLGTETTKLDDKLIKKDIEKIADFLNRTNIKSYSNLTEKDKEAFLNLFRDSDIQPRRAIYFKIRSVYMNSIYNSPIGEQIAHIKLPRQVRIDLEQFMKDHPLNLSKVSAKKKYDVIVVGSGPAGSVIAHELQLQGKSVLLLERGSFYHPGAIDSRKFSEFSMGMGNLFNDDSSIIFRAGQVAGGGTSVNIDLAFSPELKEVRDQIEKWRAAGYIANDQFSESEIKEAYQYIKSHIGTRTPAMSEINANNQVLLNGAKKTNNVPRIYDLNTLSPNEAKDKITDKKSSVEAFLLPAMKETQNPLHFRPNANVNQILFEEDGKTVKGLSFKITNAQDVPGVIANPMGMDFPIDQDIEVLADKIILSAGSIGTPQILLKSQIKNKNIGKHIVAHPSMPIIGKFNHPINILDGTLSTVYVSRPGYILESTSASPGYAAVMMPGSPRDVNKNIKSFNNYAGFGVMLVDESSMKNQVYLDKNGVVQIHYDLTETDKKTFVKGIAEAARIMFAAGATEVILPSNEFPVLKSMADVERLEENMKLIKNSNVITSAHIQGTARMGLSPDNSVVDSHQMVWGTTNLFVADSSIHPMSIGANPMQSIYTFAKIFADQLK